MYEVPSLITIYNGKIIREGIILIKNRALLLLLIAIFTFSLTACGGGQTDNAAPPAEDTDTGTGTDLTEDTEEGQANQDDNLGKRSNPVPIGQTVTIDEVIYDDDSNPYEAKASVTLLNVTRGQEAWDIIKAENQFNEAPAEGYEYALVELHLKVEESETEDYALFVTDGWNVSFVSADGKEYEFDPDHSVVVPNAFEGNLYKGAELTGYAVQHVREGDNFLVKYSSNAMKDTFFSIEE